MKNDILHTVKKSVKLQNLNWQQRLQLSTENNFNSKNNRNFTEFFLSKGNVRAVFLKQIYGIYITNVRRKSDI